MSKTKTLSKKSSYSKRDLKAYYYIAPWILGFAILQLYPFISSLFYSFTDYSIGSDPVFVGLANYVKLFTKDKDFSSSNHSVCVNDSTRKNYSGISSCNISES